MHVRDQWSNSLSFGDYIVNWWEMASELSFGEGPRIYDSALLLGDMAVGRNTWIDPFNILDGLGGLVTDDHCSISAGVQIYTHDTVKWAVSGGLHLSEHATVRIGNRCYIGPNAAISKGVTIGDGCMIGANSFVNRDLPAKMKARGTTVRVMN